MKVNTDKASTWKLTIECPDCKSELDVEAADVYWLELGSFDEFDIYYRCDCGACKSQIDLTKMKLPEFIKRQARKG